jgi:3-hydroxyisobutyrate dehydrogenase-like beta-hydroxyacid dehydrogenase
MRDEGAKVVGIVGLGLIGISLARRLIAAGYEVHGYDVDAKRNALLKEIGGHPCGSLGEVGSRCRTILIAVLTTEQVEAVVESAKPGGPMGLTREHVLVSVSTADPDRIAALAGRVAPRGVRFLEFPISGNSDQIALGNGLGLTGGERSTVAVVAPVLDAIVKKRHHLGLVGAAGRAKLAVNLVGGLNRAVLAEGLAFAESMGLDLPSFLLVLKESAAYNRAMDTRGEKMIQGDFAPHGKVMQSRKDFRLMHDAARRAGQQLPLATVYLELIEACVAAGESELDNSAVFKELKRRRSPESLLKRDKMKGKRRQGTRDRRQLAVLPLRPTGKKP